MTKNEKTTNTLTKLMACLIGRYHVVQNKSNGINPSYSAGRSSVGGAPSAKGATRIGLSSYGSCVVAGGGGGARFMSSHSRMATNTLASLQ